ncbi:unnamed protein product [Peronospora destructor]|uniref:Glycoside hydrolase 35 catalytic domain-containing protein n=1 Tax=Peronospora destructor TaxID=86335 RepID=A0AAV0STZ0_9STRA|nr:unnamed protein product [Peronospora destructor]
MFEEDTNEVLLPVDVPSVYPQPRRLRRMDIALIVVLLMVTCFISARPPALRTLDPLWVSNDTRNVHYLMRFDPLSTGEELLRDAKRDGLNHIEMYVFWNLHEQERGVFNFEGNANITKLYQLAAEVGLFLHVRFGPYVCAEWSNGDLPMWLNWVPGMKVRSSNAPWQRGPIIMAQIENELEPHEVENIKWCGDLVKQLDTSIPWVMRNANAAENTILSCDANNCFDFAKGKKRPLPNDQRTPQDVAYAVAQWFAIGVKTDRACHIQFHMYHGGNNYGRGASAGVTTLYADGVNLHSDGLSNEPKRSHLHKLHKALIECNDILLLNDRQLLNPHSLAHAGQQSTESSSQQRAFVYGPEDGPGQVAFMENMENKGVTVVYKRNKYDLAPNSILIVKNGILLFLTLQTYRSHFQAISIDRTKRW